MDNPPQGGAPWSRLIALMLLISPLLPSVARAQVLVPLTSSNVIGGSGHWGGWDWDNTTSQYHTLNVVNQQTGAISEPSPTGYWLGNNGSANEYFVIDLGAAYNISQIDLFNTHNQAANDRGTNAFTIHAANSVTLLNTAVDYDLFAETQILAGSLGFHGSADPLPVETFNSGNGLATGSSWRYLKFTEVSYYSAGGGLNEIRVYGSPIPEPSTYAMGAGAVVLLLALLRRWQATVAIRAERTYPLDRSN